MLRQNNIPRANPAIVPKTPTLMPATKKIRMMVARDAPIVRSIAIELALS